MSSSLIFNYFFCFLTLMRVLKVILLQRLWLWLTSSHFFYYFLCTKPHEMEWMCPSWAALTTCSKKWIPVLSELSSATSQAYVWVIKTTELIVFLSETRFYLSFSRISLLFSPKLMKSNHQELFRNVEYPDYTDWHSWVSKEFWYAKCLKTLMCKSVYIFNHSITF